MKLPLSIISYLYFTCSSLQAQTLCIRILDTDTQKPLKGAQVYLANPQHTLDTVNTCTWLFYNYPIVQKQASDALGTVIFEGVTPGLYTVVATYNMPALEKFRGGYGVREAIDSNIMLTINSHYSKVFNLMVTCPYDKTKAQSFCPTCKKRDKVQEIVFGLPIYDENGHLPNDGKYYNGNCFVDAYCNPTKHCTRCDRDF